MRSKVLQREAGSPLERHYDSNVSCSSLEVKDEAFKDSFIPDLQYVLKEEDGSKIEPCKL